MSLTSEEKDVKFRNWKRNLESRAKEWSESHPESTRLDTSSFFGHLTHERPLLNAWAGLNHVRFYNQGVLQKILNGNAVVTVVPNSEADGWTVKVGGIPIDTYFGGSEALEFANDRANEIKRTIQENT